VPVGRQGDKGDKSARNGMGGAMLTIKTIDAVKAKDRVQKLYDGGGLLLFVTKQGFKSWRYDYRFNGKQQTLVLGAYPEMSLAEARDVHMLWRKVWRDGKNPILEQRRAALVRSIEGGNTFRALSTDWLEEFGPQRSAGWLETNKRLIDQHAVPKIGAMPIDDIKPAEVLAIIDPIARIEKKPRKAESVRRVISQVCDYAATKLRATSNPARGLRKSIVLPKVKSHRPLKRGEVGEFFKRLDALSGRDSTRLAIRLMAYTFVRVNELLNATWSEFDLEAKEPSWTIPATRMKKQQTHVVPLSRQAIAVLKELRALAPKSEFVVSHSGTLTGGIQSYTINVAFDRMGYKNGDFVPHGLRATASTLLNEDGERFDLIEKQLAHQERNRVRAAYNHADYLKERRVMMQKYADLLDTLSAGGNVVPFKKAANGES